MIKLLNLSTHKIDFFIYEHYSKKRKKGGDMRELRVEVQQIKERCGAMHRVGDVFFVRGEGTIEIPEGKKVCIYALNSLFPFLTAKQREDELPHDDWIAETEMLCCPDPNGVVFRVTPLS